MTSERKIPHSALEKILIVRHGETDWNHRRIFQGQWDTPLNRTGRKQAEALARRLSTWKVDAIYCSDLQRATETANILAKTWAIRPNASSNWREMDLGNWCGLSIAEIESRYPAEIDAIDRGLDIPRGGGETRAAFHERIVDAFGHIQQKHAGESVMIVTHGGAVKVLVAHLIGLDLENIDRISPGKNTGLTIFEFANNVPQLTIFNDSSHFANQSETAIRERDNQSVENSWPG